MLCIQSLCWENTRGKPEGTMCKSRSWYSKKEDFSLHRKFLSAKNSPSGSTGVFLKNNFYFYFTSSWFLYQTPSGKNHTGWKCSTYKIDLLIQIKICRKFFDSWRKRTRSGLRNNYHVESGRGMKKINESYQHLYFMHNSPFITHSRKEKFGF